ncbi:hypothetical protein [Microvirga rosea]|uniref:hypothetical protein n=1 Tax=Microvirga rosea TaxID=2715425 RepID=UPI001D0B0A9B|nr:hypothetical protein [Microvirga rosea]MCB8821466.1 hypothetical protein [Microvirga rosea]
MTSFTDNPLLRYLGHGAAAAALLGGMALMAFTAGLAFLGAMVVLPIGIGLMAARRRVQGDPDMAGAIPRPGET